MQSALERYTTPAAITINARNKSYSLAVLAQILPEHEALEHGQAVGIRAHDHNVFPLILRLELAHQLSQSSANWFESI